MSTQQGQIVRTITSIGKLGTKLRSNKSNDLTLKLKQNLREITRKIYNFIHPN